MSSVFTMPYSVPKQSSTSSPMNLFLEYVTKGYATETVYENVDEVIEVLINNESFVKESLEIEQNILKSPQKYTDLAKKYSQFIV